MSSDGKKFTAQTFCRSNLKMLKSSNVLNELSKQPSTNIVSCTIKLISHVGVEEAEKHRHQTIALFGSQEWI